MRCQLCLNFSWQPFCSFCLETLLSPSHSVRILENGLHVHSFYSYEDVKKLLHTKHSYHGHKIFMQLGKYALKPFMQKLSHEAQASIPIDDHVRSGYSHSAVLAHSIKKEIKPLFGVLRAQNKFRYSGQKRVKRLRQKRDFTLTCTKRQSVILIDDIVTTGQTMQEAQQKLLEAGFEVVFGLVLADAKR